MEHDDDGELMLRSKLYIICGIIVLIPNSLCLIVFNSSKDFRQRFVFFTMLCVSDMLNGISFILSGNGRIHLIQTGQMRKSIFGSDCITSYVWPIFLLVGGQLPATFTCLLTVERFLAVSRVSWYRSRWTWRYRLSMTIIGFLLCLILNLTAYIVAKKIPNLNDDRVCTVMDSAGIIYGTIHYCWIAGSYFIAFAVTLNLFCKSSGSKFLAASERRKQIAILILSGVNVIMVSFPNIVLVVDEWYGKSFDVLSVGIAYLLYGLQSCFNLPIFYFFRLEFRRRLHDLLKCRSGARKLSNDRSCHQVSRVKISTTNKVDVSYGPAGPRPN